MYGISTSSPTNVRPDGGEATYQASQVKRSAPALCLLRSCLRRNVAPLEEERALISTGSSACWEQSKGGRTIQPDHRPGYAHRSIGGYQCALWRVLWRGRYA